MAETTAAGGASRLRSDARGCWLAHCDGTAVPNPGAIGVGAVLVSPTGDRHELSLATGDRGCSNEAEAAALLATLDAALALGARELRVHSDSVVLVEQTTGKDRTRIERLAVRYAAIRARFGDFASVELRWVPRRKNAEADALARAALGLPPKPATR